MAVEDHKHDWYSFPENTGIMIHPIRIDVLEACGNGDCTALKVAFEEQSLVIDHAFPCGSAAIVSVLTQVSGQIEFSLGNSLIKPAEVQ